MNGMAYATGTRLASASCWLLGAATLIGIPLFWPLAYWLQKKATQKEDERERELDALENAPA